MPRCPRIKLAGHPQHIVQRGINREPCFYAEEDYHSYLHWLQKAAADWRCAIHAYVLMTNHVHLLVTPHPLHLALGPDEATRQAAYRTLFRHQLDDAAIADIRLALNQSQPLGSDRFADRISAATGIRRTQKRRGRPQGKTHPPGSIETQPDFGF